MEGGDEEAEDKPVESFRRKSFSVPKAERQVQMNLQRKSIYIAGLNKYLNITLQRMDLNGSRNRN